MLLGKSTAMYEHLFFLFSSVLSRLVSGFSNSVSSFTEDGAEASAESCRVEGSRARKKSRQVNRAE